MVLRVVYMCKNLQQRDKTNKLNSIQPLFSLPFSPKLFNIAQIQALKRSGSQCTTTIAVNFHPTMTMREGERERESWGETDILSSQQMSVTVENVMSLSLSICQAAVPSATLPLSLSFIHSQFDFQQDIYRGQDRGQYHVSHQSLVACSVAACGQTLCFPSTVSKMVS